jgi:hypothetical protein
VKTGGSSLSDLAEVAADGFDRERLCGRIWASVVGTRRTSEERLENSNNEPMKPAKSRIRKPEAGAVARQAGGQAELGTNMGNHLERYRAGKRRSGKDVFTALSGWEIGKWCSFSHLETALTRLFPHKSTQVVDFPHLGVVRHFLDANFANERELGQAKMNRRDAEPSGAWNQYGETEKNHRSTEAQGQAKLASKVGRVN